jgi:hypothetical protein
MTAVQNALACRGEQGFHQWSACTGTSKGSGEPSVQLLTRTPGLPSHITAGGAAEAGARGARENGAARPERSL